MTLRSPLCKSRFKIMSTLALGLSLVACGDNALVTGTMPVALIDTRYSYDVNVEREWTDDQSYTIEKTEGTFPTGILINDEGLIYGTPTQTGEFPFELTLYEGTDSVEFGDSEDFLLFVTEASTNDQCPLPNREDLTEVYLCVGAPTIAPDETLNFTLDLTLYLDPERAARFELHTLEIVLTYDPAVLEPDTDLFTSQVLREAATAASATFTYTNDTPGTLRITLETDTDEIFEWPGRLLDLPFHIIDGATLTDATAMSLSDATHVLGSGSPTTVLIDGSVAEESN